ncbi:MAG: hypothetical protein ACYSWQ_13000 [Planctomycetota bacterium]|jgi:hypothetical protein
MTDHQFIMSDSGRCGTITYHEGVRRIEIYWEISGNPDGDIVVWPNLREWSSPENTTIGKEHQLEILRSLRQWLKNRNKKSNIDLPSEVTTTDKPCIWANCDDRKIKGSPYCLRHYELDMLGY